MERRSYIKNSCTLCLGVAMFGLMQSLQSCATVYIYKSVAVNRKVTIPISLFQEKKINIVRIKEQEFDIGVVKNIKNEFIAFELRCTHANNGLVFTGKNFVCNLHGSKFSLDGNVIKGPAEQNLKAYSINVLPDQLEIIL